MSNPIEDFQKKKIRRLKIELLGLLWGMSMSLLCIFLMGVSLYYAWHDVYLEATYSLVLVLVIKEKS